MRRLAQLVLLLFLALPARAQIAFDATANSSGVDGTDVTSVTFPHTVVSNTNGIIVVPCAVTDAVEADRNISTITYNGVGLSLIGKGVVDTIHVEMWRLVAPATGANNVVVTAGGTADFIACGSVSLIGVDQASPVDVFDTDNFNNSTTPSLSITTVADNAWIIDIVNFNNHTTSFVMDALSGRTERWNFALATTIRTGGSTRGPNTPAGAFTMSWTAGAAAAWNYIAASFKPAAIVTPTGKLGGGAKIGGSAILK